MPKKLHFTALVTLSVFSMFILAQCSKGFTNSSYNLLGGGAKTNFLPGPCPFECHDTRCQAYLNGYCGTAPLVPLDTALTQAQFTAAVGGMHNDALCYMFTNTDYSQSLTSIKASQLAEITTSFFQLDNHMTVDNTTKNEMGALFDLLANNNFYLANKPKLDSAILATINSINPTLTTQEASLLTSALGIFTFDSTVTPNIDTVYATIISRANTLLSTYNSITWSSNTGDAIGGYLNIVISSTTFWRSYAANNQVPPCSGTPVDLAGGGSTQAGVKPLSGPGPIKPVTWIRRLAWPEMDALGYIWGWSKAWLIDEVPTAKERIKKGLGSAAESSGFNEVMKAKIP